MSPEAPKQQSTSDQNELITKIPDQLGGQAVREEVLADQAAAKEQKDQYPVQGVHTDIVSGRVQGHSYLTDTSQGSETNPKSE